MTPNQKHTPTPWQVLKVSDCFAIKEVSLPEGFSDRIAECIGYENSEENSLFIVKAVNSHDRLVRLLHDCKDDLEKLGITKLPIRINEALKEIGD